MSPSEVLGVIVFVLGCAQTVILVWRKRARGARQRELLLVWFMAMAIEVEARKARHRAWVHERTHPWGN